MRLRSLSVVLAILLAGQAHAQQQAEPAPPEGQPAQDIAAVDDPDGGESVSKQVPLAEIRRFVSVYNAIREAYVEPVADEKLMHSALRGLLLDLDPHSVYFDKDAARDFNQDSTGAYDGVGLELQQQPGPVLKIIAPLEGGPGDRAGLKSGDIITAINGKPISDADGSTPLRGEAGSSVKVTIYREGKDKPFDVTLVRERIRLQSVRQRMLEPGYGYVRVSSFQSGTAEDFSKAVNALKSQSGGKLKGLLIDLRSNPGGLLTGAVQMADDLLDSGVIVSTRGRLKGGDTSFSATRGDMMSGGPVVVLVDAGSASASEVLAGALRDHKRARIVGSRTFGKGSVQTLLPLDNGDAVKLTTARYYTPSGRSIQGVGIAPDVILHPEDASADDIARINEAALPGHLRGEEEGEAMAGENAGAVLPGDAPMRSALAELKRMAGEVPPLPAGKVPPITVEPAVPTTPLK
ncbi:S41 family peptidase [Solilutibacter tolerans]|uniref:C-terminal processing peptidase-3. Serine peptidase. MEROPS family S41A n=1 Tax=Solilutibacter tolerans TaxID=1604334 RepID=A0A1N6QVL8_9GAMM|nr:S41 family peptidase [Lysobacter tolerans]SIQ20661.1 C-terminal processing peptidase-3. Serine peptidase. MEROPS family S41A [Lysobacter tolerans]